MRCAYKHGLLVEFRVQSVQSRQSRPSRLVQHQRRKGRVGERAP